jgi:hypothetical protein
VDKMLTFERIRQQKDSRSLQENMFFEHEHALLFLPSRAALALLDRCEVVSHSDSLYEIDQAVFGERTICYLIRALCPLVKVYPNLVIFNARKVIDASVKHKIFVQNNLPHFSVVNSTTNNVTMFCRNVTTTPKT